VSCPQRLQHGFYSIQLFAVCHVGVSAEQVSSRSASACSLQLQMRQRRWESQSLPVGPFPTSGSGGCCICLCFHSLHVSPSFHTPGPLPLPQAREVAARAALLDLDRRYLARLALDSADLLERVAQRGEVRAAVVASV